MLSVRQLQEASCRKRSAHRREARAGAACVSAHRREARAGAACELPTKRGELLCLVTPL